MWNISNDLILPLTVILNLFISLKYWRFGRRPFSKNEFMLMSHFVFFHSQSKWSPKHPAITIHVKIKDEFTLNSLMPHFVFFHSQSKWSPKHLAITIAGCFGLHLDCERKKTKCGISVNSFFEKGLRPKRQYLSEINRIDMLPHSLWNLFTDVIF